MKINSLEEAIGFAEDMLERGCVCSASSQAIILLLQEVKRSHKIILENKARIELVEASLGIMLTMFADIPNPTKGQQFALNVAKKNLPSSVVIK